MIGNIQIPTIILPTFAPLGTEVELINDAVEHVSLEPIAVDGSSIVNHLVEKTAFIYAQEIVAFGVPANLLVWVEVSPYPTVVSGAFWSPIGLPVTIVGTGVNLAVQNVAIPWNAYSPYIRLHVQTAVPVVTAAWAVQVLFAGQGG